ncbi:MAG TPA: hypothetical protein VFP87_09120 [Chitinophagaceae bacterium]|nr:hypothetical protein [Chitinophagaceae bacterium]
MRAFIICVLFAGMLISTRCRKNLGLNAPFSVAWHHCSQGKFGSQHVQICFDSLLQDSRCPIGAMCVWQGTAVVRFGFTVNDSRANITLSTLNLPGSYHSDTTLMGYKIEFLNLQPFPQINVPRNVSDYKADLKITKS